MHRLLSPSCIDEKESWVLTQMPKRTCGPLQGKADKPAEGWGIYYQEGWDELLIAAIVFVIFLLGSLIFGILWTMFTVDIQGAFTVSAYIVAACGVFLSFIVLHKQ